MARFTQIPGADQSIDEFIAKFDLLRRKAESKLEMGTGFPEQFATILRMHNAGLPRQEKSPVMASSRKSLKFLDVAANMRSSFGSCGGGGRQDVLIRGEADGPLVCDKYHEARVKCKKSKKPGVGPKRNQGMVSPRLEGLK